jgi:signal peptidase I
MENTVMTGDFLFVNRLVYAPSTPQVVPFFNIPLPFLRLPGYSTPEKGDVIVFIFPGNRDEAKATEFQYYLKRCVATAGDTLQVINKKLLINGKEMPLTEHGRYDFSIPMHPDDPWRTFPEGRGYTKDNYGPIRIPKEGDIINLTQENLKEWKTFIMREGHDVYTDGTNILIDDKPVKQYKVERDYVFGMGDNRDNSSDSRYFGFIPEENIIGSPLIVYWSWDTNLPMGRLIDKLGSIRISRIGTLIQ